METKLSLLRRLWRPDQLVAENITPTSEEQDRSSMADFVRILQDEVEKDALGQDRCDDWRRVAADN
jgi:hypothetical protein